jgi:hypothetical protein
MTANSIDKDQGKGILYLLFFAGIIFLLSKTNKEEEKCNNPFL